MPAFLFRAISSLILAPESSRGPFPRPRQNRFTYSEEGGASRNGKAAQEYGRISCTVHSRLAGSYRGQPPSSSRNGWDAPVSSSYSTLSRGRKSFKRSYSSQVRSMFHSCVQHQPQRMHFHRSLPVTASNSGGMSMVSTGGYYMTKSGQ